MKTMKHIGMIVLAVFITAQPLRARADGPPETIMLDMSPGTNRCFVGEAIPLTVTWSAGPPLGFFKAVDIRVPVMENDAFKIYDSHKLPDQPNSKWLGIPLSGTRAIANLSQVKHGGRDYTTLAIRKIIVPTAAGTHILEPARMTCLVKRKGTTDLSAKGKTQGAGNLYQYPLYFNNTFFDREISPGDTKLNALSSNSTLRVLSLPMGQPSLFSGLVGQYKFSVSVSTNSIRRGDPVVLSLEVSSRGYLSHVKIPPLELQKGVADGFRIASDRRLRSIDDKSIVFTQTVYPLNDGRQTFPTLSLCYFNPISANYETSDSKPISLVVAKARIIDGTALGVDTQEQGAEPGASRWILAFVCLAVLGAVIYVRVMRREKPAKEEQVDLAFAYRQARNTLSMLKETDFENARDRHSALNSALTGYVAAHLVGHRAGAITFRDVEGLLQRREAGGIPMDRVQALFREMDMCRFSPAAPTMEYAVAVDHALEFIEELRE
ncbi:MAG: BatD family protein [Kiritimatiellia bacterium]|jgi:hypothetical protein|nr:BatD family protein [Kiritimatiellia bacterium]